MKNKIAIIALAALLVLSNVWWAYWVFDSAITVSHKGTVIHNLEGEKKQLMAILPEIAGNLPKEKIIEIAQKYSDEEPFEKEGIVWIDWIGLKFDSKGKIVEVVSN